VTQSGHSVLSKSARNWGITMGSNRLRQLLLLCLLGQDLVFAQNSDEHSIPEPTELSTIASSENSSTTKIGNSTLVAGSDTVAEVTAVKIELPGKDSQKGVRLLMTEGKKVDRLMLDFVQAEQLRQELSGFQSIYTSGSSCSAREMCIRGVARCRPSQTESQAVCPSYYNRPDGSQGIRISTPRHTFDFPFVEPAVFAESIVMAIGWHNSVLP